MSQLPLMDSRPLLDDSVTGDEWATPQKLFEQISAKVGPFGLDAAAAPWNAKCERCFTKADDALSVPDWGVASEGKPIFLNPPYSRGMLSKWMPKAVEQATVYDRTVACLVPVKSSEGWWCENVLPCLAGGTLRELHASPVPWGFATAYRWEFLEVVVSFVKGRVRHIHETGMSEQSRFPSAVVVYRPGVA